MSSSIPTRRTSTDHSEHRPVRSRSLRALAVAARLERRHAPDGPPGGTRARENVAPPPEQDNAIGGRPAGHREVAGGV